MRLKRALSALWREPLVGFALVGGMMFWLYSTVSGPELDRIVVKPAMIQAMVDERELLLSRPLTDGDREALVQQYLDEEVLVREAYAQGLDRIDGRVRRQLIKKMSFLIEEEPPEPTAAELQALYKTDPERYRKSGVISMNQVLLKSGTDDAEQVLRALRTGDVPVGINVKRLEFGEWEVIASLGEERGRQLLNTPVGTWSGPFRLPEVTLLVQVLARQPSSPFPPDMQDRFLREDWQMIKRREIRERKLTELRKRYQIEREASPSLSQAVEN